MTAESGSIVRAVGVWEANAQAVWTATSTFWSHGQQAELKLVRSVKSRSTLKVDMVDFFRMSISSIFPRPIRYHIHRKTRGIPLPHFTRVKHHSTWIKSVGHSFTTLVFSTLGHADNNALRLLTPWADEFRSPQATSPPPSSPHLTPVNISFSRLWARLNFAVLLAGAARGSGRASALLGSLRSFTSHTVCARDPASLSPVFLRVRTNPCDT